MTKNEFRKQVKGMLAALSDDVIAALSRRITDRLTALAVYEEAGLVLSYISVGKEAATDELIKSARNSGKQVYVPRIAGQELVFHLFDGHREVLLPAGYGIPEPDPAQPRFAWESAAPKKILIIVPAVAFDRNKNRLGRGKGYYDRFLASARKHSPTGCTSIGICFSAQLVAALPVHDRDIPVDMVVTDQEIVL